MKGLDGWTADNFPTFTESALGIFTGMVVVGQLLGAGAGVVLGPFLGWALAIFIHQYFVAGPRREEEGERYEERQARRVEEHARRRRNDQEMARLRVKDPAEYKRRCRAEIEERKRSLAESKARSDAIMERGRRGR
jgi:hypothetical protein